MDFNALGQVLMKWSLESEEYQLSLFLFMYCSIGIPGTYFYKLKTRNKFKDVHDYLSNSRSIYSDDIWMKEILRNLKNCKWMRLPMWKGVYGYKYS